MLHKIPLKITRDTTVSRNRKKLGIAGFSVTALFFLFAVMYSPDSQEKPISPVSMSSSTSVSSKVVSPQLNSGSMSIRNKQVTLLVNKKISPLTPNPKLPLANIVAAGTIAHKTVSALPNSELSLTSLPVDTMAKKPISPLLNTKVSLENNALASMANKPMSPLPNTESSLANKPVAAVANKPVIPFPNSELSLISTPVAAVANKLMPSAASIPVLKTPEPFVFPERVHLELGFYVNTPSGKVKGTNTGYLDWSHNSQQPRMRWDELYDVALINEHLPLLYDGVAGPNKEGEYKYWSMDRNGLFKCMKFPFPKSYPRDLLKKLGTYHGQKLVDGKLCDIWSYKFMGANIILYVDASDNTKLVREEITMDNGNEQEVVQVYNRIKLTLMTKEIDPSIFVKLPQLC